MPKPARRPLARASAQAPLDPVEDRLPVGVTLLVVAQLSKLGRREAFEPVLHLSGGELVVAGDRKVRRRAPAVGGLLAQVNHVATGAEHPLEVREEVVGGAGAAGKEALRHLLRVRAR